MKQQWRSVALAGPILLAVFGLVLAIHAHVGDVFTAGAPAKGPSIQRAVEIPSGSYSVSGSTGAAAYRFPIVVPPGRAGMEPSLSLDYSSQNPMRGGVAAGWSLQLPSIEIDTSSGHLLETVEPSIRRHARFRSSLAGGQRLIPVSEPGASGNWIALRAENDASYVRYEYPASTGVGALPPFFRALAPSGRIFYFGEAPESRDGARWFLTRAVDPFGNEVLYTYQKMMGSAHGGMTTNVPVDIAIASIEYTRNPTLRSHARILFKYGRSAPCPGSSVPRGARFSFKSGVRTYLGAALLGGITIQSRSSSTSFTTRRQIALRYDAAALDCNQPRGTLRLLSRIDETVWSASGVSQTLPPISFDYGTPGRTLQQVAQGKLPRDPTPGAPAHTSLESGDRRLEPNDAGGWPSLRTMLVDLDADGFLDLLKSTNQQTCATQYFRGAASNPSLAGVTPLDPGWPTMPWRSSTTNSAGGPSLGTGDFAWKEGCNLGYQMARRSTPVEPQFSCSSIASNYSAFRLMDVDGDGVVELLSSTDYKPGTYRPADDAEKAVLYHARYGGAPASCPAQPFSCRLSNGDMAACTGSWPTWLFAPIAVTPPACGENTCREAGCVGCTNAPCSDEQWNASCPCSVNSCNVNNNSLAGCSICRSEVSSSGRFGPKWQPGDVGAETSPAVGPGSNANCRYLPEHCENGSETGISYLLRMYRLSKGASPVFSGASYRYSPVPFESDRGTATYTGIPASSFHAVLDLDGDSCPDALWQWPEHVDPEWSGDLQVWRGDCAGGFQARADGSPWTWPMPDVEHPQEINGEPSRVAFSSTDTMDLVTQFPHRRFTETRASLVDINGDSLPDYVVQERLDNQQILAAYFNTGSGFELTRTRLSTAIPTISREESVVLKTEPLGGNLEIGWSKSVLRSFDFDSDGLVDVVGLPSPDKNQRNPWATASRTVAVNVNQGDFFHAVAPTPATNAWHDGLAHIVLSNGAKWRNASDARDLNNDGLPDSFPNVGALGTACAPTEEGGGFDQYAYDLCGTSRDVLHDPGDAAGQGLRFLRSVNNGRGLNVRFEYGSSADGDLIERDGDSILGSPMWVVKRMTVEPGPSASGGAAVASTTSYSYTSPVVNRDPHGRYGFRGFKEVQQVSALNASGHGTRTVDRYAYDLDHSGRLREQLVFDETGDLLSLESHDWRAGHLLGMAVSVYLDVDTRQHTCDATTQALPAGAQEDDCRTRGALRRTTRSYQPKLATSLAYSTMTTSDLPTAGAVAAPGASTIMYVLRGERQTESAAPAAPDDRGAALGETVLYAADRYQLLSTDVRRYRATGASWSNAKLVGRSRVKYDASDFGTPIESTVWSSPTRSATTRAQFDTMSGNRTHVQKPEQAEDDLWSEVRYDEYGVHPAELRNELVTGTSSAHVVWVLHDLHTGALVRREGPIQSQGTPVELTRYDGLGRVKTIERTTDPGFTVRVVQSVTYDDAVVPNRVTTDSKLDHAAGTSVRRDVTFDGLGRPLVERLQTGAGTWQASSYVYDAGGNAVSYATPSPTGTGTATYAYQHDAMGRVLLADAPGTSDWSFTYDGLATTRRQVLSSAAPADGSVPMVVTERVDPFGRLRQVVEARAGGDAVTTYHHDANGNLDGIVDADGLATTMAHDWVGHRIGITRAGRTWTYGYDLNGNLESEVTPGDGLPAVEYTSTWAYDALDRLTSSSPAPRGLSDSAERYSLGATHYVYDEPTFANGIGRLTTVALPFGRVSYAYSAEGLPATEWRRFDIRPAGVSLASTRSMSVQYNALGAPTQVIHADVPSVPSAPTVTRHTYDPAGRELAAYRTSIAARNKLIQVDRNQAGLATVRFSRFAHGQTWSYDALGRVTYQAIRRCAGATVVTSDDAGRVCALSGTVEGGEGLAWLESGNVGRVTDLFSATSIDHAYDSQHQIVSALSSDAATANPPLYAANFEYTPAGRIRHADLASSTGSPEVRPRDVTHVYDDDLQPMSPPSDPAAVRALVPVVAGQPTGTFGYDARGNLTSRSYGPESHTFVYDGDDRLRETLRTGPNPASEIAYYDHTGQRVLAYSTATAGAPARLRQWFGASEIEYTVGGSAVQSRSDVFVPLGGGPAARIHRAGGTTTLELLYGGVLGNLLTAMRTDIGTPAAGAARYGYGPFGEQLYELGPAATDFHRRFNGKEHDELSHLSYYGARYYDRLSLTWTQADPLSRVLPDAAAGAPRAASLYAFSLNNPVRYIDPDGLDAGVRARGAGEVVLAGMGAAAVCGATGLLPCVVGGFVSAIYAARGAHELITGEPKPHAVTAIAGEKAGALFDAAVFGWGLGSFVGTARASRVLIRSGGSSTPQGVAESGASQAARSGASQAAKTEVTALTKFYPENAGFAGATERTFLMPGQIIDRYGGSGYSRFFSPQGTADLARSLPPGTAGQPLRTFEVAKPFEVQSGKVAPWFNQPGGGLQYRTPVNLDTLLKRGIIKPLNP
ncbi:glycohydrolase toxin TNT-related protein [Edaphobacter modestus]|uniref:RHS repeat-associated protein n=1 Tax=Edaphobacter modestus TaxID=388466 RepID=A0A4V2G341_9BACT|nr:glycohydrolase toxin TNT-related protein [Edaphobacter modestus]RZU35576.1 RHS repeat-associated protein [Edaphobacter modestus]